MTGMEVLFAAMAIGGAGMEAFGAIQQGQAEAAAAKFNAKAAEQQARSEREAAAVEASDYKRGEMGKVAAARTARLATGVTMAGSPLLVDEATIREVALGVQRYRHSGAVKGNRLEQEAQLYRMRGKSAVKESYFRAGTSILNAGSSWAGSYA